MQQRANDPDAFRRLVSNWSRRAGIRRPEYYEGACALNRELPDYPINIVPFAHHPTFERAPESERQEVLTWAWIVYNERVIEIEHLVTNPAINSLLYGVVPGADDIDVRQALRETMIDEQFHLLMHEMAVHETSTLRNVERRLDCGPSIVYRKLREHQAASTERWQQHMLRLIWSIVSEMTINSYLNLLATAEDIQPLHRQINWLHNADESAHNKMFVQITKMVFGHLNGEQRQFFIEALPKAVAAFTAHDFSAWASILERVGLCGREEVLGDCGAENIAGRKKLMSDISSVERLMAELQIDPQIDDVLVSLV